MQMNSNGRPKFGVRHSVPFSGRVLQALTQQVGMSLFPLLSKTSPASPHYPDPARANACPESGTDQVGFDEVTVARQPRACCG